jgi:TolB-like protein
MIIVLSFLSSCATVDKHIYSPSDPIINKNRTDFTDIDFVLSSFQVFNLDDKDKTSDINYLRNIFVRYIISHNKFRDVKGVSLEAKAPDDRSFFNVEVVVYPDYTKYSTIVLDIPFFYPFPGVWPISPLWGTAAVKVKCDIFDRKGELITSFQVQAYQPYYMIFYHFYRTAPIEDALQSAYKKAFEMAATSFVENRDFVVGYVDSLNAAPQQNKKALFLVNGIDSKKQSIAVLDLDGYGISSSESRALTNRLTTELFKSKVFNVVERAKTEEILDEQGFQLSGCTSSECLIEAGKLLNVELMLGGSISKVGSYYSIELRIINVENGAIISVASVDIEGDIGKVLVFGIKSAIEKILQQ